VVRVSRTTSRKGLDSHEADNINEPFPPLLVFSPTTVIIQAGNLLRRFVGDNTNKGGMLKNCLMTSPPVSRTVIYTFRELMQDPADKYFWGRPA